MFEVIIFYELLREIIYGSGAAEWAGVVNVSGVKEKPQT